MANSPKRDWNGIIAAFCGAFLLAGRLVWAAHIELSKLDDRISWRGQTHWAC